MKKILLTAIMISILSGALLFAGGAQETAERPLVVAMELQYPPSR